MANRKNSIELSPKYGVNPTIPLCFWCGKPKDEIALVGRLRNGERGGDYEAPKNMVIDYEPCPNCQMGMAKGITLIEATDHPLSEHQAAMQENAYPTGRWIVIKPEAAKRVFPNLDFEQHKVVFIDHEIYQRLTESSKEAPE